MDLRVASLIAIFLQGCFGVDLNTFLQPLDVTNGKYDNFDSTDPNLCTRKCDGRPKICYYKFHIENYAVMGPACGNCPRNRTACFNPQCITADGVERGIISINRMLPGTSIQVCKGDKVVVDVTNAFPAASTTVHWHGVRQIDSPYMDGVPMVTQCPISPAQTFRYQFGVHNAGTLFYHSHTGLQKLDGHYGSFVVREPQSEDPSGHLYDYDLPSHVITVIDWMHTNAEQKAPGLRRPENMGLGPDTYLINGKGLPLTIDNLSRELLRRDRLPLAEFNVKPNKKYRFRIVASTCSFCPFVISVVKHKMTVITGDAAGPVEPTVVDSIALTSGERFDFVLETNQPIGQYWIVIKGLASCQRLLQVALLKYEGSRYEPLPQEALHGLGKVLNYPNYDCSGVSDSFVCFHKVPYAAPIPPPIYKRIADQRLHLSFGMHNYDPRNFFEEGRYELYFMPAPGIYLKGLTSNISTHLPPSPALSQLNDIPKSLFCDGTCQNPTLSKPCDCLNVYKIKTGNVVDVIVTDSAPHSPDGVAHPFHLHGYNFHVLEEGIFTNGHYAGIQELHRRLDNGEVPIISPPMKDTIAIPSGGYVIIRFLADNPGVWILHCHIAVHAEIGMAALFQVGEPSEFPPVPAGFPTCKNFLPEVSPQ